MDDLDLLIDFHLDAERQGPGGADATRLAVRLSGLAGRGALHIADIGCGTGASTRILARDLDAHVTAVDLFPAFLERLDAIAAREGLGDRITTRAQSMDALDFAPASLDAVWAEGAIYNMGFQAGAAAWSRFLKPGGVLAVSEITWLTEARPADLEAHWRAQYAEIDTASAKMAVLERAGLSPVGYFVLPQACWTTNYYAPAQDRFEAFLDRHGRSRAAEALVAAEREEIALYARFNAYFGYGFYIARKPEA